MSWSLQPSSSTVSNCGVNDSVTFSIIKDIIHSMSVLRYGNQQKQIKLLCNTVSLWSGYYQQTLYERPFIAFPWPFRQREGTDLRVSTFASVAFLPCRRSVDRGMLIINPRSLAPSRRNIDLPKRKAKVALGFNCYSFRHYFVACLTFSCRQSNHHQNRTRYSSRFHKIREFLPSH